MYYEQLKGDARSRSTSGLSLPIGFFLLLTLRKVILTWLGNKQREFRTVWMRQIVARNGKGFVAFLFCFSSKRIRLGCLFRRLRLISRIGLRESGHPVWARTSSPLCFSSLHHRLFTSHLIHFIFFFCLFAAAHHQSDDELFLALLLAQQQQVRVVFVQHNHKYKKKKKSFIYKGVGRCRRRRRCVINHGRPINSIQSCWHHLFSFCFIIIIS